MFKIKSATRLALTIGFICAILVWTSLGIGILPDPSDSQRNVRLKLTKAIAVTVSSYAESRRYFELESLLKRNIDMEEELVSVGIKRNHGQHLLQVGPHATRWKTDESEKSADLDQVQVDILANGRNWGHLEIVFKPTSVASSVLIFPFGFIAFLAAGLSLSTWAVLSKTFKYLNPSKVVPSRVRDAYDSLSSGLVLMTNSGEIAHSNAAFRRISGSNGDSDSDASLGQQLDSYDWRLAEEGSTIFPWNRCLQNKIPISGEIIEADITEGITQKYMVNATPIFGSKDTARGVLVSFEDVTALEAKKAELSQIIQTVRMSRDEVERQNEKLNFLASYDPLTKCMNRRAFFGHFEQAWADAKDNNLSLIIMDIDFFKAVNDNHGHSAGDQVLTKVGEIMTQVTGSRGLVCRYGGEEFVVMVPDLDVVTSCQIAEDIRIAIERDPIAGLSITASLGVSNLQFGPMDPQHMLDQADQCLYAAKRNGRNQVVRFDECPAETEEEETQEAAAAPEGVAEIEYSSVTGLLSALSFRCPTTAEHSIRVADLCVAISQDLMNNRELYRLEIAALLHDVGKIGVPDAILNKPGN